jgi:uncharacterized membrane protein YfcA
VLSLLAASVAAFALALVSAVAGFGGGVLLLPVFTALFGLRAAVPMLTITQLASNASRVWLNRTAIRWRIVGWFTAGAAPFAIVGGLLLAHAPMTALNASSASSSSAWSCGGGCVLTPDRPRSRHSPPSARGRASALPCSARSGRSRLRSSSPTG